MLQVFKNSIQNMSKSTSALKKKKQACLYIIRLVHMYKEISRSTQQVIKLIQPPTAATVPSECPINLVIMHVNLSKGIPVCVICATIVSKAAALKGHQ